MYEDIIMPKMGESITEGTIIKWLKKEGDEVNKDENIVLISTDKVEAEIPSPGKGFLIEIKHKEGATVEVGEVLGSISSKERPINQNKVDMESVNKCPSVKENYEINLSNSQTISNKIEEKKSNVFLSPLVKKLVKKYNIDQSMFRKIDGTGLNNRITKVDILNFVRNNDNKSEIVDVESGNRVKNIKNSDKKNILENNNSQVGLSNNNFIEKDISNLRKTIMDNMIKSKEVSAHVSTFFKVNYSNIKTYKEKYTKENSDYKLTYTDFVVSSVSRIIGRHPYINSEIRGDKLLLKKDINLGIAVAVTNPEPGLLVPVIKNADQLNILGISKGIKNLSTKVRNKKITIEELSNGTFTITNPGNFGAITNTPIINQPQVAILGMGTIHKEVVVNTENNIDSFSVGPVGWLSLTFDHRVIDGLTADSFMRDLKDDLENWKI